MKKFFTLFAVMALVAILFVQNAYADVTKTVGGPGTTPTPDYATLKAAFDAINAGTIKTGVITLQITGSTTEAASAVLNASGSGSASYTSVSIYPTITGLTIGGNLNASLIDLNGADNVTIDGRVGATGLTKDLIITNTSTSSSSNTSTIRFVNSAENNTVKYCTIKGSETSSSKGIIFFDGASSGNGNDGNTIDNNNITSDAAGRPVNAIFSLGSSGYENSGNIISNNNIYDFLKHGTASNGINLNSFTTAWTITGNSFYETGSFSPTASVEFSAIRIINADGNSFTVSSNYIGGNTSLCGGSAWTKSNAYDNIFYAIYISVSNTVASSVQSNTIQNFSWGNSGAADWAGIYVFTGSVNIGTTTGNVIGSSTGTGSVSVTGGSSGTYMYGINIAGTGTIDCQKNIIGSITAANASANASNIIGINKTSSGITTISNNTIGSATANSINASSASTGNAQSVIGINNTATGTLTINNNTIANLTNATTNTTAGTAGVINGIASTLGTNTITNNTIHDLTIANANTSITHTASVCGIALSGSNTVKTVTGNAIYNLSNTYASFAGSVIGLYFIGSTGSNVVSRNFIHSLSVTGASSSAATLFGLKINEGASTCSNNIISLGGNTPTTIYGIYEPGTGLSACNLYFNTVYIGGSLGSGITNKSYCFYSANNGSTRNYRDNIFENARSTTGGTSLHYAAYFNYFNNGSLTLDYNDYYTTGTGGVLGYYNGADKTSLPLITGLDAKSLNINPAFAIVGGTTATEYKPTSVKLEGTYISTVSTDYALTNRAATPTIGAYETTLNLNVDVYKAGVFQSSYTSLKGAFDKINAGSHTGALQIRINANTTETASAVLNASGSGSASYTSINIFPTVTGITVSGNIDAYLIDLNGADNVVIDGRVNATGSTKDLIIANTNTGSTSASTIRFYGSAENNTVKYCTIKGSGANIARGIIFFSSASSGNGNDGNTIDHNNITSNAAGRPINAIYSAGAGGYENSGNIVSNNNIYDFLNANSSSNGIHVGSASIGWAITGNSFYETSPFSPSGANTYCPIRVSTLSNHTVSGNYIGGREPLCAGSPWTITANFAHYFCGIYITGGTTAASTVENNFIRNIAYTSTEDNPWDGIYINDGNVNVTCNTIGAETGTGSITVTTPLAAATTTLNGSGISTTITMVGGGSGYTTAPAITFSAPPAGGTVPTATAVLSGNAVGSITVNTSGSGYTSAPNVYFDGQSNNYSTSHGMIKQSSGTVTISNNNIGSITTVAPATYSHGFESLYVRGVAGVLTISNNLIGSLSTANSIQTSSTAATSLQKQDVYGIYSSGIGTTTITGNTIANLHNAYSGTNTGSRARGIQTTMGSNTIQNNTVRNISTASAQSSAASSASLVGISQTANTDGTTQTVTGNTVYDLSNTNAAANVHIFGMYYAGPNSGTNTVSGNFVHSLSLSSSNTGAVIYGIAMNSGVATCANNIINLGGNTIGYLINGIWDGTTNYNVNFYFNTVYIGGSVSPGVTSATAALNNANNTSTRNYRNNILYNARTGGTTGKHYAIVLAGTANTTIDYNDYFFAGSVLGKIGTLEKADLAAWKLGTSQDANSLSINPGFTIPGGTSALNYYTSASLPGVSGTGITTDYYGNIRAALPKMGALETNSYTWQGGTSDVFGLAANWTGGVVPPDGADISFAANPDRNCVLDQNRILGDITNAQGTDKLVVNGKQLTITGNLVFSGGAEINATAASSAVIFAGTNAQSIPSGAFTSNTIESLTVNNVNGLALNGDFTINEGIALIAGNFTIGANTLTFNGIVTAMTGTVTGGTSTNMIIGGTGSTINMPAFVLNNLTINRASGVSLYGDLSIVGTLALSNGTLTLGANTLTLSGSSPTRTSGFIDASNSGATLVFSNTAAIMLPASIFSAAVNNMTINGAGGITSCCDITVNGVLNLQSANPSATKGKLDMWDGSTVKTLTMGSNATTTGIGDVTGIVKRTSFVASTEYSFGNQFTTMTFAAGGPMPTDVSFKITIGSAPSLKTNAIQRIYDIIRSGGDDATRVALSLHYLDSELQTNTETNLVIWDFHIGSPNVVEEHGKANQNTTENWVAISNRRITYFGETFDPHTWGLSNKESANFTWQGTPSTDWNDPNNWSGGEVPSATSDVVITDAATTIHDPVLPESPAASVRTINIQSGGILEGGTATILTVAGSTGSWFNQGTFSPGTSTVVFTNANATMADPTNFYNVTIANGASLTPGTDNVMRIAGALTLVGTGILRAALLPNTIEFNGTNQIIVNPNGLTPGYYNLILSGSGTKTMPATALSVAGDFTTAGTAIATAGAAMTIGGELTIEENSTFATGAFNHTVKGAFDNSGTFTASAGYAITLNGASAQSVYGASTTTFDKLTIDNSNGIDLYSNFNVNNTLTLTAGSLNLGSATIGINGTISKTAGFIDVGSQSSLSFGGTSAITLPDNLFASTPSIKNLTIDRSGGVTLGNQSMTINGLMSLPSGTFSLAANTLTLAGSSLTRTSGFIDASNGSATLAFTNTDAITLPASIFTGNVNNLTINGIGGITATSDFSINGILYLQSVNPSATKGSLDMWDGSTMKTLTMGAGATTVGPGDVTGIITRTTINPEVTYTFGNEFTTAYFPAEGTMPTNLSMKSSIGTEPSWQTGAIAREIAIIQTTGNNTKAVFSLHYLDTELNGNDEGHLVLWVGPNPLAPYGRSAYNSSDNWVSLSNINVGNYFSSDWEANKNITLDEQSTTANLTWNGSVSDSWTTVTNWTPNEGPSSDKNIIIPDASTTLHSPTLPSTTEIKTLTIDPAGILNSDAIAQLTINGGSSAWNNAGTFNPSTGNVIFTGTDATISGTTNFYDVTIPSGKVLWMTSGSTMRIAGSMINPGTLRTVISGGSTTVEYNGGNQTVVVPNASTNRYSTLILSGSGTKTLPATALGIEGDFSMSGTASATALAAITTAGDFTLGTGTTFDAGSFSHSIGGNFTNNDATFTTTRSTFTFNGTAAQTIGGTTGSSFNNLTVDNTEGVTLTSDALTRVTGTLAVNEGKKFEIAPGKQLTVSTLTNNAGNSGLVIHSDETGTGSLINSTSSVPATVERYIPYAQKWHFLSAPVSEQPVWPQFAPTPDGTSFGAGPWNWDFYYWNPNASLTNELYWVNLRKASGAYNDGTVDQHDSYAGFGASIPNFTVGRGYLTAYNTAWNPATDSPETHLFTGSLNSGTVTKGIIADVNSFNLVGNPYPSAIDWKAASGWTRTNLVTSGSGYDMWIYNPAVANYGVCNSATGSSGTNDVTKDIAPMQAFFVQAASSGNLTMTSAVQVHSSQSWLKDALVSDNLLRLQLATSANTYSDEMIVAVNPAFADGGSSKFWSMLGEAPELYSMKGGSNYSIDRLPSVDENTVVALGVKAGVEATYTISATGTENFHLANSILLEDLKTGTTQELKNNPSYSFSASPSDGAGRFHLHFGGIFGIGDQEAKPDFSIFSNNNSVFINNISGKDMQGNVRICNVLGQEIIQKRLDGDFTKIDLAEPAGFYIVSLAANNRTYSKKVFIH